MVIGLSGVQFGLLDKGDNKIGRPHGGRQIFFIMSTISDRIRRHEVLPIYHKNHNFRGKRNNQVMKENENLH